MDHHVGVLALQPDVRAAELTVQVVAPYRVVPEDHSPGVVLALDAADYIDPVPEVAVQPVQELRWRGWGRACQDGGVLPAGCLRYR
ncbi:MAG: hypothetical protein ACK5X3_09475 [Pseudomonadota bacterium]